jgi:hypothetical protein
MIGFNGYKNIMPPNPSVNYVQMQDIQYDIKNELFQELNMTRAVLEKENKIYRFPEFLIFQVERMVRMIDHKEQEPQCVSVGTVLNNYTGSTK